MRHVSLFVIFIFFTISLMANVLISENVNKDIIKEHSYKDAVKILSEKRNNPNLIRLRIAEFDPMNSVPSYNEIGMERVETKNIEDGYYIVQFNGSVKDEYRKEIENIGGKIFAYVANHAFIVKMSDNVKNQVEDMPFVRWVGDNKPAFRVDPKLLLNDYSTKGYGTVNLTVVLFKGEDIDIMIENAKAAGATILKSAAGKHHEYIRVEIDENNLSNFLQTISNYQSVEWIEEYQRPVLLNDWSRWIIQSFESYDRLFNDGAYDASADTVSEWHAQIDNTVNTGDGDPVPIYSQGIYGQGQVVGIADTGLDYDNAFFRDPSESVNFNSAGTTYTGSTNHRKIVGYQTLADDYDLDSSGHGTHTSGSIAGDKPSSLGYNDPTSGIYDAGDGMAPLAKLAFQDIGDSNDYLTGIPSDLNDLFAWAYDAGARIHSDSWGTTSADYSTYAQNCDEFTWDYPDMLILIANGNAGPDANTVGSPATAKNVIGVGATNSGFGTAGSSNTWSEWGTNDDVWGDGWRTDGLQDNTMGNMAWFSSHGPTDDGLMKPLICAPGGHYIWSANSDGDPTSNNSDMEEMGGTSMATPTMAGAAALVRQYYTDGYHPDYGVINPSGMLLKATLVLSSRNMTEPGKTDVSGGYTADNGSAGDDENVPTNGQGWGRIRLDDALYFDGDSLGLFVSDGDAFTSTGQSNSYSFITGGQTCPVKVVLAWYDYPSSSSVGAALVNDLDLIVGVTSDIYYGNQFTSDGYSDPTATTRDAVEPVEVVWIPSVSGSTQVDIEIDATDINYGPQSYSVVAYYYVIDKSLSLNNVNFYGYEKDGNVILNWTQNKDVSGWVINDGEKDINMSADIITYTDTDPEVNASNKYTLYALTAKGKEKIADITVYVTGYKTKLYKASPSPFINRTNIAYSIAKKSNVNLDIYSITGRKVKTLVNGIANAGNYNIEWNGTDDNGNKVAEGMYIYMLKVDGQIHTDKVVILK